MISLNLHQYMLTEALDAIFDAILINTKKWHLPAYHWHKFCNGTSHYYQHNRTESHSPMNNIIIQIIVLGAILLLYNYRKQIHRYLDRLMNDDDREGIFQESCSIESAFDRLNIEYKKDVDDEGNTLYMFKYQAGGILYEIQRSSDLYAIDISLHYRCRGR